LTPPEITDEAIDEAVLGLVRAIDPARTALPVPEDVREFFRFALKSFAATSWAARARGEDPAA